MSRRAAIAAAVAAALLVAALLVAAPHQSAIVLGRPGDAPFLSGFGPAARHRGLPGRWTTGLGRVDLAPSPLAATLTLQIQASDTRPGDAVEVFVDGRRVSRVALPAGRQTLALAVPGCDLLRGCRGARLAIQSAPWVDAATGETRGVFVARLDSASGGLAPGNVPHGGVMPGTVPPGGVMPATGPPGSVAGAPAATWASAVALTLGIVALAFAAAPTLPLGAALASWAAAALWIFRLPLAPCWPWLAIAAAVATIGAVVGGGGGPFVRAAGPASGSLPGTLFGGLSRTPSGSSGRSAGFAVWAAALVGLLFVEAFTRGWVLGQPQMLDAYYPWRAALPATWEARPGPPMGDVAMLVHPLLAHVRERLLHGDLPLWTASLNAGQPLLAAYQGAVFSPITWTALLVPLPQATVVIAMLRLLVGGVGMFVFVRGLGLSPGAAWLAGTAFLLNPFTTIWLEHPPGGVPPFLPWMLHAASRAAEGQRFGPAALAAATALVLLAGHPHTGVFSAALAAAWSLAHASARGDRWRRLPAVTGALILGAALAAIQIVPFLEYLLASRGYAWRQFGGGLNATAAPALASLAALVPRFFGEHAADTYAGPLNYLEQTMYAGIPVLILAVAGVAAGLAGPRRDWRAPFFGAAAILATLTVYGAPGVLHLISALPLVNGATLTRVPIVAITAAIVAAAFGADALTRAAADEDRRRLLRASVAAALAIGAVILVALAWQRSFLLRSLLTVETWRWSLWALLLAAGTISAIAAVTRQRLRAGAAVAVLTVLVALDLFVAARGFHAMQPADRLYPAVADLTRLRDEAGPFRVVGAKGALMPNSALVYGLQDIRAYDGLGIAAYADLLDVALAWAPAHQQHELHDAGSPVLDLLNVRYLLAPPDFAVDPAHWSRVPGTTLPLYRNARERPRTFLVDGYVVDTGNASRRRLRDGRLDAGRQVLLDTEPAATERPEPAPSADAVGTARIVAYTHQHVAIDTQAPGRRLLVLSDTWFPGWRATVDGGAVPIVRANHAFRAVSVPAGRHRVEFTYAPTSFRIGALLSALSLAAIALWARLERRGRRLDPAA